MIVKADARRIPLADNTVQCVVSSPPYWGLRRYSGEQELVWGDQECLHEWGNEVKVNSTNHTDKRRWNHTRNGRDEEQPIEKRVAWLRTEVGQGAFCQLCGAWRGAFGLEPTIKLYVEHSVRVLREIRRVLRDDGICFWNIGDSYSSQPGQRKTTDKAGPKQQSNTASPDTPSRYDPELKPKDMCLIPARIAIAAQEDGWWVRSWIVWAKPNPMPESVTDRPTNAWETILMLTKSATYYWDAEAVKEPVNGTAHPRGNGVNPKAKQAGANSRVYQDRDVKHPTRPKQNPSFSGAVSGLVDSRNLRNVWEFSTAPYPEAHFATFPPELPRRCILAASRPGDLILDPFGGSGTVARVALELNRRVVSGDLAYHDLAVKRTAVLQPMLI